MGPKDKEDLCLIKYSKLHLLLFIYLYGKSMKALTVVP